ncbi:hypothetical protein BJ508DRAFT_24195 [Ascobolus immersus RN42]|uniref:Uncharacterized protein n=1 Tax=Ascobolus immersus RN42 TaxID=1160509 RepID=A0A3N4HMY1_ASCIM|nr:hypothetical protein BJ508DRAFT_24195 [Ascobolus immersus RN42]
MSNWEKEPSAGQVSAFALDAWYSYHGEFQPERYRNKNGLTGIATESSGSCARPPFTVAQPAPVGELRRTTVWASESSFLCNSPQKPRRPSDSALQQSRFVVATADIFQPTTILHSIITVEKGTTPRTDGDSTESTPNSTPSGLDSTVGQG